MRNLSCACRKLFGFVLSLTVVCSHSFLQAAEPAQSKSAEKAVKRQEISPEAARSIAKDEVTRAEAKAAQNVDLYDPVKLKEAKDKLTTLQNHPDLVAARNELAGVMAKPILNEAQHEKVIRMQQGIWEKEKALLIAEKPELKEIIEGRERLTKELMEGLATRKAPPETIRAAVAEMKAREEARTKGKQKKE